MLIQRQLSGTRLIKFVNHRRSLRPRDEYTCGLCRASFLIAARYFSRNISLATKDLAMALDWARSFQPHIGKSRTPLPQRGAFAPYRRCHLCFVLLCLSPCRIGLGNGSTCSTATSPISPSAGREIFLKLSHFLPFVLFPIRNIPPASPNWIPYPKATESSEFAIRDMVGRD